MAGLGLPAVVYTARPMTGDNSGLFTVGSETQQVLTGVEGEALAEFLAAALTAGLRVNTRQPTKAVSVLPVVLLAAEQVGKWLEAGCDPSAKSLENLAWAVREARS